MEQDLAYRFGVSQPTISRTLCTWMNFLYLKPKEIPLWPSRALVQANMPWQFMLHIPELQQMIFSNYKNSYTFKGLVGISPEAVITFARLLFPGSISDKKLTRQCGILDLLEPEDLIMADCWFNIEEDLLLKRVQLNIPPFLWGKVQSSKHGE